MIKIPVSELEFAPDGNTIWVHSPLGATVLRIKAAGGIKTSQCDTSPVSHADIFVEGEVDICLGPDAQQPE